MSGNYEGLPAIGRAVGKSPSTIQRWINQHGLPACKLPNGNWFITDRLIDSWVLARNHIMMEQKKAKPPVFNQSCTGASTK